MSNTVKLENAKYLKTLENPADIDRYFLDQAKFLSTKQRIERIDNFNNEFDFLNNEYETPVYFNELKYPNVSNAYQSARTDIEVFRKKFQANLSLYELYDLSSQISNPIGWEKKKMVVMEILLRDKFIRNEEIKTKLAETGTRELVNAFKDKSPANLFWGVVGHEGENHLGKLLMKIRQSINDEKDLTDWIELNCKFPVDKRIFPRYKVSVIRDNAIIDEMVLTGKPYFTCGNWSKCDIKMAHLSISKKHCFFGFDQEKGIVLVDTNSQNGTYVNDERLEIFKPFILKNSTFKFKCGFSTRSYQIEVDFKTVKSYLEGKRSRINDPDKENTNTIFVSGSTVVPSRYEIELIFDMFGEIKKIDSVKKSKSNSSIWFTFVTYFKRSAVEKVLKQPGIFFKNEKLIVKLAEKETF